jgi:hypothetical protein
VVGSVVTIRSALPCGRSRGGELGEERRLTGRSQPSATRVGLGWLRTQEHPGVGAELGRHGENGPQPFSDF